ncbi:MAG TPA: hypothetical protein VFB60_11400 [Ktedonobacteraceae bacterium]|nr:hypothetical protein [Ktedonobacteraceae bacterium]
MQNVRPTITSDDTTLEEEYEIVRFNALPPELQRLAALHVIDQFEAVPSYVERFSSNTTE